MEKSLSGVCSLAPRTSCFNVKRVQTCVWKRWWAMKPINDEIDITCKIGPLGKLACGDTPEWPMYSYERPSWILWDAVANELHRLGWTEEAIKTLLQSKSPRYALDGDLGDLLRGLGISWARAMGTVDNHETD